MSKSYKNTIPLFGSREDIQKAVMSIVTDSSGERPQHVYAIHKLFRTETELETLYTENHGKYKNLKDALIEDIDALIAPMREKRASITDAAIHEILKDGAARAQAVSNRKLNELRNAIGISL